MKAIKSTSKGVKVDERKNDLRIFATNEETLNKETALKIECNYGYDFGWGKCILPDEFLNKKYLQIEIDQYSYYPTELKGTYSVILEKKGDKKYVGKESFDLYNYTLEDRRTNLYLTVSSWGEGHKLDLHIKKIRKPAYKSPSKYFPKKENYVSTLLRDQKKVQLSEEERIVFGHLFNITYFDPKWFFETSSLNEKLKLSGQMFDKIIESLIEKKILEKHSYGNGYSLFATI